MILEKYGQLLNYNPTNYFKRVQIAQISKVPGVPATPRLAESLRLYSHQVTVKAKAKWAFI